MLDPTLKTQLAAYLTRLSQDVEIVLNLDESATADDIRALLKDLTEASPRLKARIAGVFYLLTFLTGVRSTGHQLENVL